MKSRRIRTHLARVAVALVLMVVSSVGANVALPDRAGAQVPTPPRPLLLIGGTLVDVHHSSWPGIKTWLRDRGGYEFEENLFIGEMCKDTSDDPYDFLKCSLVDAEGNRLPPPEPSGWDPRIIPVEWRVVTDFTAAEGGSTAGWAAMRKSVDHVATQINLVRAATGASQIDIIAHSQAGVIARAAVKRFVQAGQPSPVANLVALGAPQYGASPLAPLYDQLNNFVRFFFGIPNFFDLCRDENLVPFCRDIYLTPPASTNLVGSEVPLTNPLGFSSTSGFPITFTYRDAPNNFYQSLNSSSSPGPVPGPTHYYHFYTRDYDGNGNPIDDRERYIVEQMNLFPTAPNVTNVNIQDLCVLFGRQNYPLHHSAEFDDPTMRVLIGNALGFPYTDPQTCQP